MREKITSITILVLCILLLISGITVASGLTNGKTREPIENTIELPPEFQRDLPSPGITPDSLMYRFKRFIEGVDLFFTFDDVAKAEKHATLAELRLAEAIEMSKRGKPEFVNDLINDYKQSLTQSNELAEIAQQAGRNTTTVRELVAIATSIHIDILEDVLKTVPEQAKPSIQKAAEISKQNNEYALNMLEEIQATKAALIHFHIAEQRLIKAQEKTQLNETEAAEHLLGEYDERINKSRDIIKTAKAIGTNTAPIDHIIDNTSSSHQIIRSKIYDHVIQNAKPVIEKMINTSAIRVKEGLNILIQKDNLSAIQESIPPIQEIEEMIVARLADENSSYLINSNLRELKSLLFRFQ